MSLLNEPLSLAVIDVGSLPSSFNDVYKSQLVQQQLTMQLLLRKANETGISASDSAKKNGEHDARLDNQQQLIKKISDDVITIQGDYVSKSLTDRQEVSGPLGVNTSLSVDGVKVIGQRVTGFTSATGSACYQGFNADLRFTVSSAYSQSEMNKVADGLTQTRKRLVAIERALRSHGLIDGA